MEKKVLNYCVAGYIFVSILGSLSHFFYDWSGGNFLVALVCPVNESTWEHMKLLFFPVVLYTIFWPGQCRKERQITAGMLLANIFGIISIPVLFYSYSGIYGKNLSFIDISIFFISVFVVFYLAYNWIVRRTEKGNKNCRGLLYWNVEKYEVILIVVSFLLAICFFVFTFYPPEWGIFKEPEGK